MEEKQIERGVQAVIEVAVQNTPARHGVRVGGVWYNGFGKVRFSKGDLVSILYNERNGYANIESIAPVEFAGKTEETRRESAGIPAQAQERDTRITKAVALKCAAVLWAKSRRQDVNECVLKSAQAFEEWLSAAPQAAESREVA